MSFFWRLLIGTITIAIGFFLLLNTYMSARNIGYSEWAERNLGSGGTYTLIKGIGLVIIIISILFILGVIKFF